MCANGKTVRFIAQSLNVIEHRITRFEHERGLPGQMKVFAASVPIRAFCDPGEHHILDAQFIHYRLRGRELATAAVNQHEVRPR